MMPKHPQSVNNSNHPLHHRYAISHHSAMAFLYDLTVSPFWLYSHPPNLNQRFVAFTLENRFTLLILVLVKQKQASTSPKKTKKAQAEDGSSKITSFFAKK